MPETIDILRQEHANIERLLQILERQVDIFERAATPDYDIVSGICEYFLDYLDACHHPKENVVFSRLRERDPEAAAAVGDLTAEHEETAIRTRDLAEAVNWILEGVEVSRESVVGIARNFISNERRHMAMEEEVFFPAALRSLTPDDWAAIDARATNIDDPLFGRDVEARYSRLRDEIIKWAHDDEAENTLTRADE